MKLLTFIVLLILVCYSKAIYLSPLLVPQSHWDLPEFKFYTQRFDDSCESWIFKAQSANRLILHFNRLALQREGEIYESSRRCKETIAKKDKKHQKEQNLSNQELFRLESMIGLKEFVIQNDRRKHKAAIQRITLQFQNIIQSKNEEIAQLIKSKDAEVSRRIQSMDFEVSLMIESRDTKISKLEMENKKLKFQLRDKKKDEENLKTNYLHLEGLMIERGDTITKLQKKFVETKMEVSKRKSETFALKVHMSHKIDQISEQVSLIDQLKTKVSLLSQNITKLEMQVSRKDSEIAEFNRRKHISYVEKKLDKCLNTVHTFKEDLELILGKFKNDLTFKITI
jgi:chromosome segregation ATPase